MSDAIFGLFILVMSALSIFWLWMLYDAFKYTTADYGDSIFHRYAWVLIVFFGSFFGMFIYYFVKKRNRPKEEITYEDIVKKHQ